jgi:hypothetical protein
MRIARKLRNPRSAIRTVILMSVIMLTALPARGQSPIQEQKLYYTCKIWGFLKYFHSRVSTGQVYWDDVLTRTLPLIESSATKDEFNNALDSLITAAGPMEPAASPSPDTLSPDLTRNLDFRWFSDPLFRDDLRAKLKGVRENFRPHPNYWVRYDDGTGGCGVLCFPFDDPCLDIDASKTLPDGSARYLLLAKYWNIMYYFNPNLHLIDAPWDSTLARNIGAFTTAPDYAQFYTAVKRFTASLNDAHVEALTGSTAFPRSLYAPRVILRWFRNGYHVVKSAHLELAVGDRIISINGTDMGQLEDSLRPLISSGNPAVFRRDLINNLLPGAYGSTVSLSFFDSAGAEHATTVTRSTARSNT